MLRHIGMNGFDDIYYIRSIKKGNTNAFVYIVRHYQKMIFTIVNRIVTNTADAEDITQEIFIKVFQSLDKFKEESSFSTWLYRIAYNTAISEVRKVKKEFVSLENMMTNMPDEEISDDLHHMAKEERLKCLDTVLQKLNPDDAMLISLYHLDDLSIDEISKITSLSSSNVKVKLYRIRKFMNFEINKLISE